MHRRSLTTTIDVGPTLLDYFGMTPPPDMDGNPLRATVEDDTKVRDVAIYGMFGAHVNITDGRHVYMRGPTDDNQPLNQYTLMPTHMRSPFSAPGTGRHAVERTLGLHQGLPGDAHPVPGHGAFRRRCSKPNSSISPPIPGRTNPIEDAAAEARMKARLEQALAEHQAPIEQYDRLGLSRP